ncbi:MAG TPA: aminotransferase class I/II-fold pyridoxal phosphate-dependent enzyme [Flavobacteriales bacterium]|jgi:perosamine synthetase|nr:aminotransferase class I/II-fold pyridoxal phosphate-dependent enzyme [Flavobacteriales bacterium]
MSSTPAITELLVRDDRTVRDALAAIDRNAQGICFITAADGRLVGVITDGDIRRALIAGRALDHPVTDVMQRSFTALPVTAPAEHIQAKLNGTVRHIPLLDEHGVPVDFASLHRAHRIQVMSPQLDGKELDYVTECLRTGWISSQGAFVKRFETQFAERCQMPHALAVSNGTVAIHLALVALGVGEGDEVIVPDLTFAASINTIIHAGATPVIADVHPDTWTLDPAEVERLITPRTKAIMPVHLYGHPCHMDELMALAKKHDLFVVEDSAEALGAHYKGRPVGSFGDASTFSFFGNKTITTGEGGMTLFRDPVVADRAIVLRDHGMDKQKRYWHQLVGFNYRLTNVQAAIGVAQLERLDEFVEAKRRLAAIYTAGLKAIGGITPPPEADWAMNGFWLYSCLLQEGFGVGRDELMEKMMRNGVETRPLFYPLHEMPPYVRYIRPGQTFPVSTALSRAGISLPSSVTITREEQESVIGALRTIHDTRQLHATV